MEQNAATRKIALRYAAVGLTLALAVLVLIASFFSFPRLEHALLDNYLEANRAMVRFLAVLLLLAAWHLHRRRQAALFLASMLLLLSLFLHLHAHALSLKALSPLAVIGVAADIAALVLLFLCRNDFKRRPARQSIRQALTLGVVCVVFVLLDVGFGYFNLRVRAGEAVSYGDVLSDLLRFVFGAATPGAPGAAHPLFEWFAVIFVWAGIIVCVLLILRSTVIDRYVTRREKHRARALVMAYGLNVASYLTLEDDKLLYFGQGTEGVVAYGIVGDVVVVAGDPICAPENFTALLAEFKGFCAEGAYECIVMGAAPLFLDVYTALGFGHIKSGEVAKFDLQTYTLHGNKMSKMRAEVNHANKETVSAEYRPNEARDHEIETEIDAVSRAWLKRKKSGTLAFTLGGVGLDDPMDRRYFIARNKEGRIVAFNVYLPFAAKDGYMADVTRRIPGAPGGVTEKLIYDAFMQFREEGVRWGSMGLAPLAGVRTDEGGEEYKRTARLLDWIYEHANGFYGFKDLHRAKGKYVPTEWEPAYFCFTGRFITPQMAYAAVRIQNPQGIGDFLAGSFRVWRAGRKDAGAGKGRINNDHNRGESAGANSSQGKRNDRSAAGKRGIQSVAIKRGYQISESADGATLYYETMGAGAPVVLLHGWGQTHRIFNRLARRLSENYFVILPDNRAHGKSGYGKSRLSIRQMAGDTVRLLDLVRIPRAAVIGFSDGGNIALEMAVVSPERVSCVIALSANAWPDGIVKHLRLMIGTGYRALWLGREAPVLRRGAERLALLLDSDRATAAQLAEIRLPIMLVDGDQDIVRQEHARLLADTIPGARLTMLRHARHFSVLARWEEWLPAACDFIEAALDKAGR